MLAVSVHTTRKQQESNVTHLDTPTSLSSIDSPEHIANLGRAADHDRLVHAVVSERRRTAARAASTAHRSNGQRRTAATGMAAGARKSAVT